MATYWVICIDGTGVKGHLAIDADDDDEAMEQVNLRQEGCDCEIWLDDRRVATMQRGEAPVQVTPVSCS
jgi:hypothetical protein